MAESTASGYKRQSHKKSKVHLNPEGFRGKEMGKINEGNKQVASTNETNNSFSESQNLITNCGVQATNKETMQQYQTAAVQEIKDLKGQEKPDITKKCEKSKEDILAEREAKKLNKQALKKKIKGVKEKNVDDIKISPTQKKNQEEKESSFCKENSTEKYELTPNMTEKNMLCNKNSCENKLNGKTKSELKAERRAKQEAQRAKKLEKKASNNVKNSQIAQAIKTEKTPVKVLINASQAENKIHKVKLFAHLYSELFDCSKIDVCANIHPDILRLGTQYRSNAISGSNARCLALLKVFKTVIHNYQTPPNQEFSRGLEAEISKSMTFINKCRPVAVSMINAVKHLKFQINQVKGLENELKKQVNDWIDTYIKEQIEKAAEAIGLFVLKKITDGDVILTYSCSSLIQRILVKAKEAKIKFRVIVVDGRPWLEGKEMLRRLVQAGISCTYVLLNGLSFIMPEVTKILLGAHALLANGYVMSRAGSSQIALLAKTYNVPVLVCCETHKFSEKVQTDSFVHNELGDPDKLLTNRGCSSKQLLKWKSMPFLTPLNLTYDVTPPDLVSAVVTEIAVLPCTSVPVILRIKPPDVAY